MKWIFKKRNILMGATLIGLIVGFSMNFYRLSSPVFAQEKLEVLHQSGSNSKTKAVDDASYWRGTIDAKLDSIESKIKEFSIQIEKLNNNLTEVKISAAKDGSIYGGVTSLIVLLASLFGQSLLKTRKKG